MIPVLINAPNFEMDEKLSEENAVNVVNLKRVILRNLVRGLYQETRQREIAEPFGITDLYNKAIAKEVKEEKKIQDLERQEDLMVKKTTINLKITKKIILMAFFIALGFIISTSSYVEQAVGALLAMFPFLDTSALDAKTLTNLFSFLTAIIPFTVITIKWDNTKQLETKNEKKTLRSYMYDYDTSTLESDLEDVLQTLFDPVYRKSKFQTQRFEEMIKQFNIAQGTKQWNKLMSKAYKETHSERGGKGETDTNKEEHPEYDFILMESIWHFIDHQTSRRWIKNLVSALSFSLFPIDLLIYFIKERKLRQEATTPPLLRVKGRSKETHKVVFIIDELDKMRDQQIILQVIESLKTLFTRSYALYVLIGGQALYTDIQEKIMLSQDLAEFSDRPGEYTLFNEILYLGTPTFGNMDYYLDMIAVNPAPISESEFRSKQYWSEFMNGKETTEDEIVRMSDEQLRKYDNFKKYLNFESRGSLFDVRKIINRRVHYMFYHPGLSNSRRSKELEAYLDISLSEEDERKAALQDILMREYYVVGDNSESFGKERVLSNLYQFLYHFLDLNPGSADYFEIVEQPDMKYINFNNQQMQQLDLRSKPTIMRIIDEMKSLSFITEIGPQKYVPQYWNKNSFPPLDDSLRNQRSPI